MPRRACLYIDGSNLYGRLVEDGRKTYPPPHKLLELARQLCSITPDDNGNSLQGQLVDVLYCCAPMKHHTDPGNPFPRFVKRLRDAAGFRVREESRKTQTIECRRCGGKFNKYPEKGVDLRIGAECLADAASRVCDIAILFSHDTDYGSLIRVLWDRFEQETKIAYLATKSNSRPAELIEHTQSKAGFAIDDVASFNQVYPRRV